MNRLDAVVVAAVCIIRQPAGGRCRMTILVLLFCSVLALYLMSVNSLIAIYVVLSDMLVVADTKCGKLNIFAAYWALRPGFVDAPVKLHWVCQGREALGRFVRP